jgi:hypothetical protein
VRGDLHKKGWEGQEQSIPEKGTIYADVFDKLLEEGISFNDIMVEHTFQSVVVNFKTK